MTQRVALITGGAKGIGRGIALDLAAQQWKIAFCYRTSEKEAKTTAVAITERGGQALPIQCDVSDPGAAKQMVSQVEKEWGHIDALINGAGPYHRINLFEESVEGWNEMFDGNLHPIFYLAQAVAPGMRARKAGRIINFSMANADQMISQPDVTAHYIAKAGVLILTRTLAKLLVRRIAEFFGLEYLPEKGTFAHNLRTAVVRPDGTVFRVHKGSEWEPVDVMSDLRAALVP